MTTKQDDQRTSTVTVRLTRAQVHTITHYLGALEREDVSAPAWESITGALRALRQAQP